MFESARIKLTLWYLLIIMIIAAFFSLAFYRASTEEIQRVLQRAQEIEERMQGNDLFPPPMRGGGVRLRGQSIERLQEAKQRILINLLIVNGAIVLTSGAAAYLLAGKTLKPIQVMIDEQNQFIANSSHELRTPLAVMRAEMEAKLLETSITDSNARELIASNLEELSRLQLLTNKLLTLAQIHTNDIENHIENIPVNELIGAAVKRVRPLAKEKQISIVIETVSGTVRGNRDRLQEVFVILLENAIKYSGEKTEIQITSIMTSKQVEISVIDHGVGIDKSDIPHVFDRFYRADKSHSQGGYGLGLAIAKEIIELHDGTVSVSSEKAMGSTFVVVLPVIKSIY